MRREALADIAISRSLLGRGAPQFMIESPVHLTDTGHSCQLTRGSCAREFEQVAVGRRKRGLVQTRPILPRT